MSPNRLNFTDQLFYFRQSVADASVSISARAAIAAITSLTQSRNLTLPAANLYPPDLPLTIVDETGLLTSSLTITLLAAGTDKINGLAQLPVITTPNC